MIRLIEQNNELRLQTYHFLGINICFSRAKTMLYKRKNSTFFEGKDDFYSSIKLLKIRKWLIVNRLKSHRYFSIFRTTFKKFWNNGWNLRQNCEITWQSNKQQQEVWPWKQVSHKSKKRLYVDRDVLTFLLFWYIP